MLRAQKIHLCELCELKNKNLSFAEEPGQDERSTATVIIEKGFGSSPNRTFRISDSNKNHTGNSTTAFKIKALLSSDLLPLQVTFVTTLKEK
jgi:hypothetical protein